MGQFSIFHWLILFVLLANLIPISRILSRTGHSPLWCLLILFPFLNMILLWVFAFKSWPIDKKSAPQP
jgi:hypothetical protein